MSLLNPTYLWALLALAVPIAIHLWSKRKVKLIKIGSTKFLNELDAKQTNAIQLNERFLLLIRFLILALLVLLLAKPLLKTDSSNNSITYLIAPSLLNNEKVISFLDTVPENSKRVLQSSFPAIDGYSVAESLKLVPGYWQLAKEMETIPSDSIVVFTNSFVSGIKGMLPEINANVQWVSIASELSLNNTVIRATLMKDSIQLLLVNEGFQHLGFEKETLPLKSDRFRINTAKDSLTIALEKNQYQVPLIPFQTIQVRIVYEDSLVNQMKYIRAAYNTAARYLKKPIEIIADKQGESPGLITTENLIWLSKKPLPIFEGKAVLFRPDSMASSLIVPAPIKNRFHLTSLLNAKISIEGRLVEQLILTLDLNEGLKAEIASHDKRVVPVEEIRTEQPFEAQDKMLATFFDLSPWLWGLLILMMLVERILAKYRRQ